MTLGHTPGWYAILRPPPLSPPNWLFGPVWTVLYVSMAVAAWLIWRRPNGRKRNRAALTAWGIQLAINSAWSPVFFGLHLTGAALGVMAALLAAVIVTVVRFWPLDRLAGALLLPYVAWVGFATYLNAGFWWLNH